MATTIHPISGEFGKSNNLDEFSCTAANQLKRRETRGGASNEEKMVAKIVTYNS